MNHLDNSEFAIKEYHDVNEIYRKIDHLISQPVRPIRREEMARYLEGFEAKYATSKPMIEEARNYIPGGVQHNLAFNYPFPIVFDRAQGAWKR